MKIEKLNENQIRCTLNKSDLDKRKLRLSELVCGSAKARALFLEMIHQASEEFGFEADNIPLMIEAIPISSDCLVLVVTKVEDPEALDDRFSRSLNSFEEFLESELLSLADAEGEEEDIVDVSPESVREAVSSPDSDSAMTAADADAPSGDDQDMLDLLAPFTQAIAQATKKAQSRRAKESREHELQVYAFRDLDPVIRLSGALSDARFVGSRLYKDVPQKLYYLVLECKNAPQSQYRMVCGVAQEYGERMPASYSTLAFFEEHFQCILSENALETLRALA